MPIAHPLGPYRRLEETKRPARLLQIIEMIAVSPRRYRRRDLARHFSLFPPTLTPELINWVLHWGSRVEVLSPPALRQQIQDEVEKTMAIYQQAHGDA